MGFTWRLGPFQFCHDSVGIRELVKPNTKLKALIGSKLSRMLTANSVLQQYTHQSIEDTKKAFLTQDNAGYAFLGLGTALQEVIPPVLTCLIPCNNRFTIKNQEKWIAELK